MIVPLMSTVALRLYWKDCRYIIKVVFEKSTEFKCFKKWNASSSSGSNLFLSLSLLLNYWFTFSLSTVMKYILVQSIRHQESFTSGHSPAFDGLSICQAGAKWGFSIPQEGEGAEVALPPANLSALKREGREKGQHLRYLSFPSSHGYLPIHFRCIRRVL